MTESRAKLAHTLVDFILALIGMVAVGTLLFTCDQMFNWDLFPPRIEMAFQVGFICAGVFILLSMCGLVAIGAGGQVEKCLGRTVRYDGRVLRRTGGVLALLVVITIGGASGYDALRKRSAINTFRVVAARQFEKMEPRLAAAVVQLSAPPEYSVPTDIHAVLAKFDSFPFVERSTLYIGDPKDIDAMWGYTAWRAYDWHDGFAKFFVTRDFEEAMQSSLKGDQSGIARLNGESRFWVFFTLHDSAGRSIGFLRVDGKEQEDYRQYGL